MKEQKAEGTRQKAAKAKRFCLLLPTAFCFLPSAFLNPQSAIRIPQSDKPCPYSLFV
ncbi:MAG TPA: hypothetical protein VF791_11520 [Pyrinomonadaceae bacterium]